VVPDDWEQEDNRCDSTKGEGGMVHSWFEFTCTIHKIECYEDQN
jgi:hypothetical protein